MNKFSKIIKEMKDEKPIDMIRVLASAVGRESEEFNDKRATDIIARLFFDLDHETQKYETGENIIATVGKPPFLGVGSHFDVAEGSPGANDNASAMAVTLDILQRAQINPPKNIGIRGFFFDEEENELRGSRAYVKERGIEDMVGFYNMEMVGSGKNLIFWAERQLHEGNLLGTIEECARQRKIRTLRIPDVWHFFDNSGDQESFIEAGMKEAFCITAVSDADFGRAEKYNLVKHRGGMQYEEFDLQFQSDLFKHYHKPTDTSEHLSQETLQMVSDVLWHSINELDRKYGNR